VICHYDIILKKINNFLLLFY